MFSFNELGIKPNIKSFEGDKIPMNRIMNKQIVVCDYIIESSKYPEKGNGKRLKLQIIVDNFKRIAFTGSVNLQEMIEKVPKEKFPFQTTIITVDERFDFT